MFSFSLLFPSVLSLFSLFPCFLSLSPPPLSSPSPLPLSAAGHLRSQRPGTFVESPQLECWRMPQSSQLG